MEERLQKLIAHAGLASRRKAEELIEEGQVTVNGRVAGLGDKADPSVDDIRVGGRRLKADERHRYVILNKRRGVVSTTDDPEGRPTVSQAVEEHFKERLYPVGRLDIDSDGLVLMTNDGELANKLTHPRYGCEKTYKVLVEGRPSEITLERWRKGIYLEGEQTAPCKIKVLDAGRHETWLRVVMREGKNRQIRRVGEVLGHPVTRLTRTHIGSVELGDLKPGHFRELSSAEVLALKSPNKGKNKNVRPNPDD
jgi:pseudouridine synthase